MFGVATLDGDKVIGNGTGFEGPNIETGGEGNEEKNYVSLNFIDIHLI